MAHSWCPTIDIVKVTRAKQLAGEHRRLSR